MGGIISTVTGGLFGGQKTPKFTPPAIEEPVAPTPDSAIQGSEEVRRRNKKKKGRTSTILTGAISEDSQVGSTIILGG